MKTKTKKGVRYIKAPAFQSQYQRVRSQSGKKGESAKRDDLLVYRNRQVVIEVFGQKTVSNRNSWNKKGKRSVQEVIGSLAGASATLDTDPSSEILKEPERRRFPGKPAARLVWSRTLT